MMPVPATWISQPLQCKDCRHVFSYSVQTCTHVCRHVRTGVILRDRCCCGFSPITVRFLRAGHRNLCFRGSENSQSEPLLRLCLYACMYVRTCAILVNTHFAHLFIATPGRMSTPITVCFLYLSAMVHHHKQGRN